MNLVIDRTKWHAITLLIFVVSALPAPPAWADKVNITKNLPYIDIQHKKQIVRIERVQNNDHKIEGSFAKTSRPCPPFCVQPVKVAPGVKLVAEIELMDFLLSEVANGEGMLIDARIASWNSKGTIPGSVNIPFTAWSAPDDDPTLIAAMAEVGVTSSQSGGWDYRNAKDLMFYCNGPWCGQSPRAIKGLLSKGFPPSKMWYYRGGMQLWQIFGLNTVKGGK